MPHQYAEFPDMERNVLKHNTQERNGSWKLHSLCLKSFKFGLYISHTSQKMEELYFHAQQKNQVVTRSGLSILFPRSCSVLTRNHDEWKHACSHFLSPLSIWSRMRPWKCCDVLLCGQRIMVLPPSWIPLQTLSESLPALWVCSILKIINTLGCKYIKLAKSNLRNENKILVLTLVLRLGLPENHREMVSKCKVPITTVLIMNKHGSSSSFLINMEPFKVILQLCTYVHFFSGERAQGSHKIFTEIHDSRKFKGNWFVLRPNACLLRGK